MRGVWSMGDDSHFLFRQKLLGEDGSVRRSVVMLKQPGLFSPKFGATSSQVFTQSLQNVAVEPGIHSLACWDRCFALPQLLYRWRHQCRIFWIPPRIFYWLLNTTGMYHLKILFYCTASCYGLWQNYVSYSALSYRWNAITLLLNVRKGNWKLDSELLKRGVGVGKISPAFIYFLKLEGP
jgi:hypothetical protein